jgi:hypothetical protein
MQVRPLSVDELEILFYWERADNVEGYIYARILQLSRKGWKCEDIALAMAVNIDLVQQIISSFNLGGIPAIAPKP